ncbi:alpha/beta hydrolase [Sphingomonas jatrophae]|uniref:Acetyl esterase/lipase n=1 Tax=Sphingomonas jatrophae TaxID=1166337 RepID=A0A1I6LJQ4_9SPHN|nr:alpha/beta hydrolase [Sphingomonas jatrophae]SFS03725.1 Acetyl esterase/lipase [Sphingomonas jatrophae]
MRRLTMFVAASLLAAAAPALMTWDGLLSRPKPTLPRERIAYGADPLQFGELWLPAKGVARRRAVVMIHGGCWRSDVADRTIMDWAAADLAVRGHPVWNIEYRGIDRPGGGYPGTFRDVAAAADAWPGIATKHRLAADAPVVLGHSAGGHLALWLAARGRLPRGSVLAAARPLKVAGAVSLGGLPDLQAARDLPGNDCGASAVPLLIGRGRADPLADTSVPRLMPLGVPQMLVNGGEDRIAPPAMARDYAAAARKAGDRVQVIEVPAQGHVEEIAPGTPAWAAALAAVERF